MIEGLIESIIDQRTVKVSFMTSSVHPMYGKVVKKHKHVLCHICGIDVGLNDRVFISSSKQYSKHKNYVVVRKI